jgi:DNA-binding MarR family transcriptional regulator
MDKEHTNISRILKCLAVLRKTRHDMPIQQASMLLLISMSEGVTLPDLAEELRTTVQSISRNAKYLSTYAGPDNERKGLDLITLAPAFPERRRLACFLTEKGKKLVAEMAKTID